MQSDTVQGKQSMQSTAYTFIKNKIVHCEYAPNQMLSESQLQEELCCSRTPIREAISRLAQEGLLKVFPKRGIAVAGFTISEISMIFEVRTLVEPYALRVYGEKLDLDEVARFAELFGAGLPETPDRTFYTLDDQFHSLLMSAMPNTYLNDLYARIQAQNTRLRIMSGYVVEQRLRHTVREHTEIADALLRRDREAAAQAMIRHLQYSRESSLAAVMGSSGGEKFDIVQTYGM